MNALPPELLYLAAQLVKVHESHLLTAEDTPLSSILDEKVLLNNIVGTMKEARENNIYYILSFILELNCFSGNP